MFKHFWMKVGSMLLHELKIKVDFRHCWPTFLWVIVIFVRKCFPDISFIRIIVYAKIAVLKLIWTNEYILFKSLNTIYATCMSQLISFLLADPSCEPCEENKNYNKKNAWPQRGSIPNIHRLLSIYLLQESAWRTLWHLNCYRLWNET